MFLIGYDIGSSFVKASVINIESGKVVCSDGYPDSEMPIDAPKKGWAEQDPEMWWNNIINVTEKLKSDYDISLAEIKAIGISYQMHGLVMINKKKEVVYPSIIWCDSRATDIGKRAFNELGEPYCMNHLLNSPGNFTASKLRWVRENIPEIYDQIYKFMLPGDFIALKMTGEISTTFTGLSEGILWDYENEQPAIQVMDYYDIDPDLIPPALNSFHEHGTLTSTAASQLGLKPGTPVSYKAGDQPNNAFSLNVLEPGEIAATAGTSGVIYAIHDHKTTDRKSRINTFLHVNHTELKKRLGILLCINGTGILNSWLKRYITRNMSYADMNIEAEKINIGSNGLQVFPFGNGSERVLEDRYPGAMINNLNFNVHNTGHLLRASQEGIVFALKYGSEIIEDLGLDLKVIKAGYGNMFLSPVFRQAFVNCIGIQLELYETDGSEGAARGAGIGATIYRDYQEAFHGLEIMKKEIPDKSIRDKYLATYHDWKTSLIKQINN